MTRKLLWMQAAEGDAPIEYGAIDDRQMFSSVFNQAGVCNTSTTDLKVSQRAAGANFSVDVAPGFALVLGTDVTGQGFYLVRSDAVENVTVPAPPASGTRTHRLVAQVRDKLHNPGDYSTYEWTLDLVEDTGSGYPDAPDSSLTLAQVSVSAGDVAVTDARITDQRQSAVTTLGLGRYVGLDSDRPVNPWAGELIWRTDKTCYELWTGTEWVEILRRGGGGSAWSTYTPAWTSSGTNPAIGNGKRVGRYDRVGRTVNVNAKIITGSSTTYGTGTYLIGLPVPALTDDDGQVIGCEVRDVSTGEIYQGHARITDPTTASLRVQGTAEDMNVVTQGVPVTFGAGDIIRIFGTYEAAS